MAIFQLKTFRDILDAVREEVKIQDSSTVDTNRLKRDINIVYDDITSRSNFWWMRKNITLQQNAVIKAGTVSITQNSTTVTFTTAPAFSTEGYRFAIDGYAEIYKIRSHTANSTTAVLEVPFSGTTNATANYKLWTNAIPLPSDCKETFEITSNFSNTPMRNMGIQEFRRHEIANPKAEARPRYYTTSDYKESNPYDSISGFPASVSRVSSGLLRTIVFAGDTSADLKEGDKIKISGSGEVKYNTDGKVIAVTTTTVTNDTIQYVATTQLSEASTADTGISIAKLSTLKHSEKYRELLVYPSIFTSKVTLTIDYMVDVSPLENDDDEPLLPIEDRSALLYGALHRAWSRERNPEEASRNFNLFEKKLREMEGKMTDSTDIVVFKPSQSYLDTKRRSGRQRRFSGTDSAFPFFGGGSSGQTVTGTANTVAIFNSSGELQGSTLVSTTELDFLDGVLSQVVGESDTNTLTNKTIDADLNTITNIDNDEIKAAAGIEVSKLEALTVNRALVSDGSGFMSASVITSSEVLYLDDVESLVTTSLTDNTTNGVVFTKAFASFDIIKVEYSLSRGASNIENGMINIATDGTSAAISNGAIASLGTLGTTFSADISGSDVRLLYTTTSTGTNVQMKYKLHKWQA